MKKLFLLSHAGGNAVAYAALFPALAREVELAPLDLPGHGKRMGEPLLEAIPDMVLDLRARLLPELAGTEGFALFGHSMGGIVAHALTASLLETGDPVPAHVFISSTCTPGRHHIPQGFPGLSDLDLWRESAAYFGGMADMIASSPELMSLFAPVLRADLKAVLDWSPSRLAAVDSPLTVLCGDRDIVDLQDMDVWRRYTTSGFASHVLPGGHFHLLERPGPVEGMLRTVLAC
jgi:medium-chain acyl-[acyl-carrier-protein] hydrolase